VPPDVHGVWSIPEEERHVNVSGAQPEVHWGHFYFLMCPAGCARPAPLRNGAGEQDGRPVFFMGKKDGGHK
jgi:hypothetical protein